MGITGFLALLLLLCGNLKPAKPIPVRPICDSRVMDKFIKEAKEAEIAMESCTNTCDLTEELSLPDPKVNVKEWMQMDRKAQAKEVWNGLAMFTRAMLQVRELVSDNALIYSVDKTYSNIRSVTRVLKSLNVQEELASSSSLQTPLTVRTLRRLFLVYSNFLRGKIKLFVSEACRQDER
ncbi:erythropoietin [Pleurodeles waltl]|uniref:erythropoietin n=1 Tax=Pleurodeles waltl TaxID=8319 RepID=UPI00370999D1